MVTGREWELNLRHHGNGIGNGNELMGMGGNGNVASHSRTSLSPFRVHESPVTLYYSCREPSETSYTGRGHWRATLRSKLTALATTSPRTRLLWGQFITHRLKRRTVNQYAKVLTPQTEDKKDDQKCKTGMG